MGMFSTLTSRIILAVYIIILLAIPIGSYFVAQSHTDANNSPKQTSDTKKAIITPKPFSTSPAKELLNSSTPSSSPSSSSSSLPEIAKTFGPTLSFSATLEARPKDNQANKMFVGIIEGILGTNPKFLLSFTVDLPANGSYSNLSLAGLSSGSTYTALLKGSAQIATSSAFTMSPNVSMLNEGQPLNLLSGDLNEDNVINSADYTIAQKALGSSSESANWNENADFNKDGVINSFDIGVITKNMGKVGASGAWTSPLPSKNATSSAVLNLPPVGAPDGETGYWIWIPQTN